MGRRLDFGHAAAPSSELTGGLALRIATVVGGALLVAGSAGATGWPQPNGDVRGTRASAGTAISSRTVDGLSVRWRFLLPPGSPFGSFASTPVVRDGTVYLQTLSSSVYALDARTGRIRWRWLQRAPNDGPNGLAVTATRVYGATDTSVFALDRRTGRRVWAKRLTSRTEQFVNIAPLVADGLVFTSTVGFPPGGRGALYALDARTGRVRWRFDTIRDAVAAPVGRRRRRVVHALARRRRRALCRHREPRPVGRDAAAPERRSVPWSHALHRRARRAPRPHRNAPLVRPGAPPRRARLRLRGLADRRWQRRLWRRQSGPRGRMEPADGRRRWSQAVGTHLHDLGPLPKRPTLVCPGPLGRRADADVVRAWAALRPGGRALHARERGDDSHAGRPAAGEGGRHRARSRRERSFGRASSGRPRPAARPSRTTSSSPQRTTGGCTGSPPRTAESSGRRGCRRGSTRARPSRATSCSSVPVRRARAAECARSSPTASARGGRNTRAQ